MDVSHQSSNIHPAYFLTPACHITCEYGKVSLPNADGCSHPKFSQKRQDLRRRVIAWTAFWRRIRVLWLMIPFQLPVTFPLESGTRLCRRLWKQRWKQCPSLASVAQFAEDASPESCIMARQPFMCYRFLSYSTLFNAE